MTTRIHIVNFGPDVVEVNTEPTHINSIPPQKLYQHQYADFYVYDNHEIVVKELKPIKGGNA